MQQTATDILNQTTTSGEYIYTTIFSILITLGGFALWIRRKLSRDSLEIKKDSAESDLIQHLEDERDTLKEEKNKILERLLTVDHERQEAVQKVGQLSVEVNHLTKQVKHLETLVADLTSKLDNATATMHQLAIENAKLHEKLSSIQEFGIVKSDKSLYNPLKY